MKKFFFCMLAALLMVACNSTTDESRYIDFLYANMSLPDSVDYPRSYYERQVRYAMRSRADMPWGHKVPEREFFHFVLPPRVNNEDMDDFRTLYYDELRQRVEGLSMADAILEINHWCHEHVTYRPTSARTLGPASCVRTAYGRCGEESVLLVAALRTVGIPARQVYTPRWAHTDDNHAWVEAWADGEWHFLGACEPEPILDLGWFNESASRGMLMHAKVFGDYDGPEEVVSRKYALTEINVTAQYAPTRKLTVRVLDSLDNPVADATVEFKVYNYAEFYTVASKTTDADGCASMTAGLGDMLVWASTPSAIAFRKVSFATDSLVTMHVKPSVFADNKTAPYSFDITPPAASARLPNVSEEQRAGNNRRLALEDSIRHAYEATMSDQRSRGNYSVITAFRDSAKALGLLGVAEQLVDVLPDKDLQDVTLDVLLDNLPVQDSKANAGNSTPTDIERSYLLSPRVERERLTPYKAALRTAFQGFDMQRLIEWTRDSVTIVEGRNPQHLRMTPLGVWRARVADDMGRDIFIVAAARAIGIPARINEVNGKVEYYDGQWIDVSPDDSNAPRNPQGRLRLAYTPTRFVPDAKYYTHFTLSRLGSDNRLQLLTYPEEATCNNTFANGVPLDTGVYVLTTGQRMADGSVRAKMEILRIAADATTSATLTLRTVEDGVAVIGALNAEDLYQPVTPSNIVAAPDAPPISLLATCGRGYYVLGLIAPNQEPTNHALRDIGFVSKELEKWGRKIVLLFEDADAARRFNFKEFDDTALPATVVWGTDIDGHIRAEALEQLHLNGRAGTPQLPVFLICDSFNRVVFVQQGYTIGLGEQLMKVIGQL